MGVYRRGKIWWVDLIVNGERVRKPIGRSKEVAENVLKEWEVKKAKQDYGFIPKDSDLQILFDEFLKKTDTDNSPGTLKRYKGIVENFKKYLGQFPHITKLSQLTPKIFEDYKAYRKGKEAQPKTINTELQTLKSIMIMAVERGYINFNPARSVDTIKITKSLEGGRWLSSEEVKTLLANSDEWLYPIFYTFIYSGMRKSELENLTWSDIDFERRIIKIRIKDDWTPKTDERDIPISDDLLKILKKQKKKANIAKRQA